MTKPYIRIEHEQGSAVWHAWRNQGIGASEAAAVLGEYPWKTRKRLLAEKCGLANGSFNSAAMAFGTATEPQARARYIAEIGTHVEPVCLQSTTHDWLRASLDGLSLDGGLVVEIKCGPSVRAHTAKYRQPPKYYVGQLQHILAVTGLGSIDFWCYLPGHAPVHVTVARDEAYIERLLVAEAAFWGEVLAFRAGTSLGKSG